MSYPLFAGIWYKTESIALCGGLFGFPLGLTPLMGVYCTIGSILWLSLRFFGTLDEKYGRTRRVSGLPVGDVI